MTGSWARARWSDACTEKEAGVRPLALALARGPSWPGGGGSRHPYPRPAPARDQTSFAFGTKQASGTHVSITPGGARWRGVSRRMSRGHSKPPPSPGASRGSWDSGGHIPALVTGRIPPGEPPPPEGSAGGARIVSSDLGSPAARGCFHRPQSASRSVTCLQVSTGFCQRRGAAPPWAQPRRWQLRDRESRRAGGVPGSRASRARGSAPSLRPRGLRAFSLASSTLSPPSPTAPRTARLSPPQAGPPRVPRPVFHPYPGVAGRRL